MSDKKYKVAGKSRFEVYPRVATLKNHQLYQWYKKVQNTKNTADNTDPLTVVLQTDSSEGSFPKATKANVHTAVFQVRQ